NCFWLFKQEVCWAFCFAFDSAGSSIAARMAMMAMTTRSSIKVNALRRDVRNCLDTNFTNFHEGCTSQPERPRRAFGQRGQGRAKRKNTLVLWMIGMVRLVRLVEPGYSNHALGTATPAELVWSFQPALVGQARDNVLGDALNRIVPGF